MGTCFSNESRLIRTKNAAINRDLKNQQKKRRKETKVLFLGAGGSGKSTIFRQINYIHGSKQFSEQERKYYRTVIQSNVLKGLQKMIFILRYENPMEQESNCLPPEAEELETWNIFHDHINNKNKYNENASLLVRHGDAAIKVWRCGAMPIFWQMQPNSQIEASLEHFLDKIEEVVQEDYIPSDADILHARVTTTSIVESQINIHNKPFRFIDVGGQRNERRKWIHCFQGVNCVVFVASLTSYAELCVEDNRTNRLKEALSLFDSIVNSPWFTTSSIVLFLNKSDLLQEYLRRGFVPDDTVMELPVGKEGRWDYDVVVEAMCREFRSKMSTRRRQTVSHFVLCALDTKLVENVFDSVQYDIFEKQIGSKGLL